ncbi:MAG: hypothetical protein WBC53_03320 [Phycisphaerae bacterium]
MVLEPEYKIEASSRRCRACGRAFQVGDEFYSAVVETEQENRFTREDYCPDCWAPEQESFFSFWRTRVPQPEEKRRGPRLVDLERLMEMFERLGDAEDESARRFRYVLALVLMRKRRLRLVSSRRLSQGRGEELTLREVGGDRQHVVTSPGLSEAEIESVADRLREILDMPEKWDQAHEDEA